MTAYFIAITSFVLFGLMPIYWSLLSDVDSIEILFHRCIWIFLFLLPYILRRVDFFTIIQIVKDKIGLLCFSSLAIATNWLAYIYAVNHGYVFEASLAYYISPIISVLLGVLFLNESFTQRQALALFFVCIAIIYLLIVKQLFPLFAGIIALSFSVYGMLGSFMKVPIFIRMAIESLIISIFLVLYLQSPIQAYHSFLTYAPMTQLLLILAGPFTILPLGLYLYATKRLMFSTVGILSFILPTIVLLLGVFYFKDKLDIHKLIAMLLIGPSVILYISDLNRKHAHGARVKSG